MNAQKDIRLLLLQLKLESIETEVKDSIKIVKQLVSEAAAEQARQNTQVGGAK